MLSKTAINSINELIDNELEAIETHMRAYGSHRHNINYAHAAIELEVLRRFKKRLTSQGKKSASDG